MSQQPTTRQELYDRIRNSSKDEVILEEMVRLGFWPAQGQMPQDPADEIRRRGEIQRQLEALRERARRLYNEKTLLADARKQRLAASRKKQQETKERHERERKERAAKWKERKTRDLLYLGEGVSGGLGHTEADVTRLQAAGLPVIATPAELAAAMGVALGELRFLTYSRAVARVGHYRRFQIPKKSGGTRLISAPMPRLKRAQAWVLRTILDKIQLHPAAHGFREGRSIVTNAAPHVGSALVINLDLRDFFPSVAYPRVKGMFCALGYSEAVATVLGLLCTEPATAEVTLDGTTYQVAAGPRFLPQGSPASPAITNVLCRRLDRRLLALADGLGFRYTRYADDLTFSRPPGVAPNPTAVGELLRKVADVVAHEGFAVHPEKTRVMHRGRRLEVTGVVVNDKLAVPRADLRRFRAALFQVEKDGTAGKRWGDAANVLAAMHGFASFVAMVDPARGAPLLARVRALLAGKGRTPPPSGKGGGAEAPTAAPASAPPAATTRDAPAPAPAPAPPKKSWKLW